jgi:hypothetical protein
MSDCAYGNTCRGKDNGKCDRNGHDQEPDRKAIADLRKKIADRKDASNSKDASDRKDRRDRKDRKDRRDSDDSKEHKKSSQPDKLPNTPETQCSRGSRCAGIKIGNCHRKHAAAEEESDSSDSENEFGAAAAASQPCGSSVAAPVSCPPAARQTAAAAATPATPKLMQDLNVAGNMGSTTLSEIKVTIAGKTLDFTKMTTTDVIFILEKFSPTLLVDAKIEATANSSIFSNCNFKAGFTDGSSIISPKSP